MSRSIRHLNARHVIATSLLSAACMSSHLVGAQQPMVEWLVPAVNSSAPQTPEQAEAARQRGRALPTAEVLQPTLDPALPAFTPRANANLTAIYKGAASDVLPGLVNLWVAGFKKYYPNVRIEIASPYAGSLGAKELVKEKVDFVFVSRELKPDDLTEFKAKFSYDPLSVPIAGGSYRHFGFLDAIGFFVHKDNPLESISYEQIDAIYSTTRYRGGAAINTWGQLGLSGEWADKPVRAYGIKPWNGFEEFVRQRVLSTADKRGEWRADVSFDKVVFPVAKRVADDRFGIGYSGLAYLDAGVKVIPVRESVNAAAIAPTYENVALARYPLARLIFFNVNKQPGKALPVALDEFLRFVLSREGQQVVRDQAIYLPLRNFQADAARALLER